MIASTPAEFLPKQDRRYFCTLFDSSYLFKGVAMITSLKKYCADSTIYVLGMDEMAVAILDRMQIDGCICVPLSKVENALLLAVKRERNIAEYCWTLSSSFTAWLMDSCPEIELLTYLDADLMFFSSPEPVFSELANASIGIIEHRFIPRLQHLESKGRFCVEWVSFRRDAQGIACLNRWRDQCLEWCYDRLEDGRMGDQKYLDDWPLDYSQCHVIQHLGAGVAPWNYANYAIDLGSGGEIKVGGEELVFFHFHQFQLMDDGSFYRMSAYYSQEKPAPPLIYEAYETEMRDVVRSVKAVYPYFSRGMKSRAEVYSRRWVQMYVPRFAKELAKRFFNY